MVGFQFDRSQVFLLTIASFILLQYFWHLADPIGAFKNQGIDHLEGLFAPNATTVAAATKTAIFDYYDSLGTSIDLWWISLSLLAAFGSEALRRAVVAVMCVALPVNMLTVASGFNLPLSAYWGIAPLAAWGTYVFWTEKLDLHHALVSHRNRDAVLKVAYYFRMGLGAFWVYALIFGTDKYIATLPAAAQTAIRASPNTYRYIQTMGVFLLGALASAVAAMNHAKKREATALGGIAVLFILHNLGMSQFARVISIDQASLVMGLAQMFFILIGMAHNEGVAIVQDGLFHPRNALGLIILICSFFTFQGMDTFGGEAGRNAWLAAGVRASPFVHNVALAGNFMLVVLLAVMFVVWLYGKAPAIRAVLLSFAVGQIVIIGHFLPQAAEKGFNISLVASIDSFFLGLALYTLIVLQKDTSGNLLGWLRSEEFKWSYEPARGGLYVAAIFGILAGLADCLHYTAPQHAKDVMGMFMLRHVGIMSIVSSLTTYLVARVAEARLLSALTWLHFFATISLVGVLAVQRINPALNLPVASWEWAGIAVYLPLLIAPFIRNKLKK